MSKERIPHRIGVLFWLHIGVIVMFLRLFNAIHVRLGITLSRFPCCVNRFLHGCGRCCNNYFFLWKKGLGFGGNRLMTLECA